MRTLEQIRNSRHPIDDWIYRPEDTYFDYDKDFITLPIAQAIHRPMDAAVLNCFSLKPKKRYLDGIKDKCCRYANYFLKYYDPDKELIQVYVAMKLNMDVYMKANYSENMFLCDLKRYFMTLNPTRPTLLSKIRQMNEEQFVGIPKKYDSTNEALCYEPQHVKIMMEISVIMQLVIPLVSHYCTVSHTLDYNEFFKRVVQLTLDLYADTVDIHAKIQETALTLILTEQKQDKKLWEISEIRGIDLMTNVCTTVDTILTSSFPKYEYTNNPLNYNIAVIRNMIKHNVTEISYEYDFIVHDSSKRDGEDNSSPMDRFEMQREKSDQGLMLQNSVNCRYTMEHIYEVYGRPTDEEINFYIKELTKYGQQLWTKDGFQRKLILNLWMSEFGDTSSIREINAKEYVSLLILSKKRLMDAGLTIFPYIISGKVAKLVSKSFVNRRESARIENMEVFNLVSQKYRNEKIMTNIMENIATLQASEFHVIEQSERNGWVIPNEPSDLIAREYLQYVLMI